jgi:hypothetical protein
VALTPFGVILGAVEMVNISLTNDDEEVEDNEDEEEELRKLVVVV